MGHTERGAGTESAATRKGIIFVLSGPSGSGKGTAIARIVNEMDGVERSVSATSRKPRSDERHGVDYYFLSPEEFEQRKSKNAFVEWAEYCGDYYGTLRSEVSRRIESGVDVLLEIDVQGGRQIKAQFPDSVLIMLLPPTCEESQRRLQQRGTDSPEEVSARVKAYGRELAALSDYDYLVWNDRLEDAVREVKVIIQAERDRVSRTDLVRVHRQFFEREGN